MKRWASRASRAILMGLVWAAVWAPAGVLAGLLLAGEIQPEHIGGPLYAGFLCGALFSAVAGIAAGHRQLEELTLVRAAAMGAVSVPLLAVLPFLLGDISGDSFPWLQYVAGVGAVTLISAFSAVASVLVARHAKNDASAPAT